MKLDDLTPRLQPVEKREAEVDVSRWLGVDEAGEPVKFRFRELDLPATWQAYADAEEIHDLHPRWPPKLCQIIAILAASHVAPKSDRPIGLVYCDFAANAEELFLHLSGEFAQAFPGAEALETQADAAKNASSTA